MIVQPPRRPKTEIELLKEEKESLQQMIDEKLLKRQYKREVKALKLQLEKLDSGMSLKHLFLSGICYYCCDIFRMCFFSLYIINTCFIIIL